MAEARERWNMVRWKHTKKDYLIRGAIALAIIIFVIFLIAIVQSALMVNKYHKYVENYTDSINHAHKNGGIMVEHGGESFRLQKERASNLYNIVVTAGMGKTQKAPPEGADIYTLSFPDGSTMLLAETDIPEKNRENDVGVYISFTNKDGETYQYDTDLIDPGLIRKTLRP